MASQLVEPLAAKPQNLDAVQTWLSHARLGLNNPLFRREGGFTFSIQSSTRQEIAMFVTDPDGTILMTSSGAVASARGAWAAPHEWAQWSASVSGMDEPGQQASLTGKDEAFVACPVRTEDGRLLGVFCIRFFAPLVWREFAARLVTPFPNAFLVTLALSGLVGAVFGRVVASRLVRRMERVVAAVDSWGAGDLNALADTRGHDELSRLAEHLNQMAGELRELVTVRQQLAATQERDRLARDLHDSVKQQLFALGMQLAAVRSLVTHDLDAARERLADAETLAQSARLELTTVIAGLQAEAQPRGGLGERLRLEADAWARHSGIRMTCHVDADPPVDPAVKHTLWLAMRETLSNVLRHSGASSVTLTLVREAADTYVLRIEDDGKGFDPATVREGTGLRSLRARAATLPSGHLQVQGHSGQGTVVALYFRAVGDNNP